MNRHSPEPWRVLPGDEPDELEVWDSNHQPQLICRVFGDKEDLRVMQEDARLIASAPAMLQMLRIIVMCALSPEFDGSWIRRAEDFVNDMEDLRIP